MADWEGNYPFILDEPLIEAIRIARKHGDEETAKKLFEVFVSYRKPEDCKDLRIRELIETEKGVI